VRATRRAVARFTGRPAAAEEAVVSDTPAAEGQLGQTHRPDNASMVHALLVELNPHLIASIRKVTMRCRIS
jgi:hypothetical protein